MDYNAAGKTLLSIKQEYQPTDGADDAEYQATAGLNEEPVVFKEELGSDHDGTFKEEVDQTTDSECVGNALPLYVYPDVKLEAECDFKVDFNIVYPEDTTLDQGYQPVAGSSSAPCAGTPLEESTSEETYTGGSGRMTLRRRTSRSSYNEAAVDSPTFNPATPDSPPAKSARGSVKRAACRVCNSVFKTQAAMLKHFRNCHPGLKAYECQTCGKTFQTCSAFGQHCKLHSLDKLYKCHICDRGFTKNYMLKKHLQSHEIRRERPHECLFCGKCFLTVHDIRKHKLTHTDERPHICDTCGKGFVQKGDLNKHSRTHTKEKPYMCEICHGRFARKHVLENHVLTHTREKPYKCEVCGISYARKDVLAEHKKHHNENYEFSCGVCHSYFPSKMRLAYHARYTKCNGVRL